MKGVRLANPANLVPSIATLKDDFKSRLTKSSSSPFLRTLPGDYPCDGFFAAIFER